MPKQKPNEQVQQIPLSEIRPFKNHPFKVTDDELMQQTIDSIMQVGVLNPAIIRPAPEGGYEMVAGHRRLHAADLAGLKTIPAIVRNLDDDEAVILMVDSNLQRETISPMERAQAYKMKLEALKHQGKRVDLEGKSTSRQLVGKLETADKVGELAGDSGRQVQRYIRLTELLPEVQKKVDSKEIAFSPAVELSYLTRDEQKQFLDAMDYSQNTPSLSQAQRLKKLSREGKCTKEAIHKALKYAVKLDLISSNPADKIERPKKERFMANFYDADEVNRLFEISKGTKLEIPILFGAFYGMRRSETLGMKWDAIDFERDTITIRHTLTTVALDGKRITVAEDRTKNKSSMRTLPLVPFVKERLLELKAEQEENRRLCGRSYVKDYTGYVCINEIGDIIKPNYVSCGFPKLLEEHGLRRVRYHDLRHSCASLLLANGVPMKQIQEWLGHSDFSTTANIYAHLEYSSKVISADAMLAGLGIGNRE